VDATIEYLWQRQNGRLVSAADWAIGLLEAGHHSDAVARLTDRYLTDNVRDQLIVEVLRDIGQVELLDVPTLMREYERESIGDYFAGRLDGWDTIHRGCDLFYSRFNNDPTREVWCRIAWDADQHGGNRLCIDFDFLNGDFDETLRAAILQSGRPLPRNLT
jgi:hypothetical protein